MREATAIATYYCREPEGEFQVACGRVALVRRETAEETANACVAEFSPRCEYHQQVEKETK